ncbi:MAG: hypothetical protein HOH82_26070, partial [Planctomycetaceae bacterium]|nr:hypothetical protein [Planctomycetaceae bacterium]
MGIEFPFDEQGDSPDTQLFRAARDLMRAGKHLEAIPVFEASMMLAPHYKTAECLGECFFSLGRLTEAVIPLAAATALNAGQHAPKLLAEVFLEL